MKNCGLLFGLFLAASPLFAQFGISGGYALLRADEWERAVDEAFIEQNGFMTAGSSWLGIDYWFRLKNKRVEFLPALSYRHFEDELMDPLSSATVPQNANLQVIGFHFNTNIYPFDFNSDCECPTWSKGNDMLKKGFFIQLAPGLEQFRQEYDNAGSVDGEQRTTSAQQIRWSLGAAVGLDIGLSDLITITPVVGLRYSLEVEWAALEADVAPVKMAAATVMTPYTGIRLGIRLDQ